MFFLFTQLRNISDKTCGWHFKDLQGFIKTPNYPGNYPNNIECTWTIDPEKGRRILVIIPEIFLPAEDKCGDKLVMRKSREYKIVLRFFGLIYFQFFPLN